jgi:crossover junction endodeoxyribonuclease RuvC
MTMIVGIDPGVMGAIGLFDTERYGGAVWDMPVHEVVAKKKSKAFVRRSVNGGGVAEIIYEATHRNSDIEIVVEKVTAMPGQGVSSVFSLGDSFGCIRGAVEAMGYKLTLVRPSQWKGDMGLSSDKEECRLMATEIFSNLELHRKKDHNRAEALLIAVWRATQLGLVDRNG